MREKKNHSGFVCISMEAAKTFPSDAISTFNVQHSNFCPSSFVILQLPLSYANTIEPCE